MGVVATLHTLAAQCDVVSVHTAPDSSVRCYVACIDWAVCCRVLQYVAVRVVVNCSVLQYVAALHALAGQCVAVRCSMLQCVLQCVVVCCSTLV